MKKFIALVVLLALFGGCIPALFMAQAVDGAGDKTAGLPMRDAGTPDAGL